MSIDNSKLDEAGFIGNLKHNVTSGIKHIANRAMYAAGNQHARGRMDLHDATKKLHTDWDRYVGRQAAAGNRQIKRAPTLRDLEHFLKFTYGIEFDAADLEKIAYQTPHNNGEPAHDAPEGEAETPAEAPKEQPKRRVYPDKVMRDLPTTESAIEQRLKAIFGKPISETYIVEHTPEEATFEPNKLFPLVANVLIDQGLMKVERNGDTLQAKGANGKDRNKPGVAGAATGEASLDSDEKPAGTASARVTSDGQSIDINEMSKFLAKNNVTGEQMNNLRVVVAKGQHGYDDLVKDETLMSTMVYLTYALVNSIKKGNDPDDIEAQHSITPSGNVFDINVFTKAMTKLNLTGDDIRGIRGIMKSKGVEGVKAALGVKNEKTTHTMYNLARAALAATSKDKGGAMPTEPLE